MKTIESRLVECFRLVRPELKHENIVILKKTDFEAWDSIVIVTLFNVIEDEFKIRIATDELKNLMSFEAIANRVLLKRI